ncbi:helix-turn-helix domain-containing protein [Rhizobium sp. CIAT894]|nr:helix-turn-helix domain-containing protein [Rhizobium sp. CIAT894]
MLCGCGKLPGDVCRGAGPEEGIGELSRREIECLRWFAVGRSGDVIAIILDFSPRLAVALSEAWAS